ncbi:hypothetical protein Cri9333_1776 [Crinalium epipsammum PCC 9333]|uniref:Cyanobacterial aminoacyl-tRNA synthetase CAAD domain-containing protein n=1 Tax=Crinalium epipsammum PCC 9333 TaxID=1173022 RepID=K9VXH5_9CYAN|nr:CAAD domain-containing protein [Crinalium epipsammum]AFZ12661.1 hypothetical protein Cri9333_1776 [Crinalium epipsammum PCC 9333]
MNTTEQQYQSPETTSPEPITKIDVTPVSGALTPVSTADQSTDEWREWGKQVSQILSELPEYLGQFFDDNKRAIISLGLLFAGIVSLKLTLAILAAINDIPLLAPTFELVGIGYTGWFVYRYLLQASTRQELSEEVKNFKSGILGGNSQAS